jgi:hypothetical protein
MALLTVTDASALGGTVIPMTAATVGGGGDTLPGGQGVNLLVVTGGTGTTVTLTTPESVEGTLTVQDRAVTVGANVTEVIPVPARYNDPSTGVATAVFSAAATRGAFRSNVQA